MRSDECECADALGCGSKVEMQTPSNANVSVMQMHGEKRKNKIARFCYIEWSLDRDISFDFPASDCLAIKGVGSRV